MEGRKLLQYIIDVSDITLAKKQEATEYLAMLEDNMSENRRKLQCKHLNSQRTSNGFYYCEDCDEII